MPEVAMVAALEREIWPLVRHWHVSGREYSGRRFRFFESENRVAVCGGIGPQAARRAAEAVIALYRPALVQSVGFAGALDTSLRVGELFEPRQVVDASDGSRADTGSGSGILVSFSSVAGRDQKSRLATAYQAQAVDMEAAAVAKGAEAHGLRFAAVKAISDDSTFAMPAMERFIANEGDFRSGAFALHAALRPWVWHSVFRLARNSARASHRLCEYLGRNAGALTTVSERGGSQK
jgi:adenosylhomocysteine nucleosidase